MTLIYLIDAELEIISYNNIFEFEEHIKDFQVFLKEFKSPLVIYTDTFHTILGVDLSNEYADTPQVLLLSHSFSGSSSSIFQLNKAGVCRWVSARELQADLNEPVQILMCKTSHCI